FMAIVTERLIDARKHLASPLPQAVVFSLFLRFDLVQDWHGENQPHALCACKIRPRYLVVQSALQECVGVKGEKVPGAFAKFLPLSQGLDGLTEPRVLVVDLLVDNASSIGRSRL